MSREETLMAYAATSVEPKRRPAVVAAACWLLYLAATCQVLSAIVTLSQLGATKQAYTQVFADTPMKGAEAMFVAIEAASAVVFGLLFAVGYVVLAILNGRGKNPARIVTWVIAGLAICLSGCALVSSAGGLSGLGGGNAANGAPSGQQIQQALSAARPGWYEPVLITISAISLLALVAAVVLLALPTANGFFRNTPEPPVAPVAPVPPPTA
jgi:hypothetical protein